MTQEFSFNDPIQMSPLAARMRPSTVSEYYGQSHIMGEGKPLRTAIEHGKAHSMILWGPPGTGKTTLAEIIALHSDAHIERISAVTSGVKDIRQAIEIAKQHASSKGKGTILFVDEVHRFNKSQQDAFLPFIEDGTVTFIGATTENPSFELNGALLSRARIYVLKHLQPEELEDIMLRALGCKVKGLGDKALTIDHQATAALIDLSGGDARRLLNYLELSADFCDSKTITSDIVKEAVGGKVGHFDKAGDQYYDMLSAFHKSVRGSSPDGALYWYARMLTAGCEALHVARRLLAIVSEDIGNADPRAMQIALNAWDIYHRVGPAEGERAIAQAVIYCASAAKSNAVYKAFNAAMDDAKQNPDLEVPLHLRNAPTELMKDLGYGEQYRYAHDEPQAYAAGEYYLPQELQDTTYYEPSNRGLEKQIDAKLTHLKQLDQSSDNKRYE